LGRTSGDGKPAGRLVRSMVESGQFRPMDTSTLPMVSPVSPAAIQISLDRGTGPPRPRQRDVSRRIPRGKGVNHSSSDRGFTEPPHWDRSVGRALMYAVVRMEPPWFEFRRGRLCTPSPSGLHLREDDPVDDVNEAVAGFDIRGRDGCSVDHDHAVFHLHVHGLAVHGGG